MNQPWVYICPHPEPPLPPPSPSHPLGHPSAPAVSTLSHALNLDWWFVSLYMFQCHSPKSSHLLPLPQSPKDYSIHLCLLFCLTYRAIITIFLTSIYMHYYTVLVFFFLTFFTLYTRLQLHPPLFQCLCMDVRVGLWRKLSSKELMLLNCGVGEDSWESLGLQGDPTSPF